MSGLPPIEPAKSHALQACAGELRSVSKAADTLASRIGGLLGGSATGEDRALAANLRALAESAYDAASAIELAHGR